MKKALTVTFGTMLAAGLVAPVYANFENSFARQSAISITGTYTQATNNGLSMGDYQTASTDAFDSNFIGRRPILIDTESVFDYGVGFTYHLCGTGTRFFLSYDHFNDEDEDAAVGSVFNLGVFPAFFGAQTTSYARVEQTYNEFRVGFSHLLSFGTRFHLDVSGFFEWDKLHRSLYEYASGTSEVDEEALNQLASRSTDDNMEGWGPGVGVMAIVKPFCNMHWGLFAGMKTSLLWVDNDFTQQLEFVEINDDETSNVGALFDPESSDSLVGKLDIKVGVDYCRVFHSDMGRVLFEAALGLRYMNMINALKNGNTFFNTLWPDASNYAANTGFPNDWGRFGPFLTFRVGGADA